jgi:hypothetical protein
MNNSTALWETWLKGEVHTSHGTATLLQKGGATPNCTLGACNHANFTVFNLDETGLEIGKKFGILINGEGTDPGTLLHFQLIMITHESSSYQVFHSFMRRYKVSFPFQLKPKPVPLTS